MSDHSAEKYQRSKTVNQEQFEAEFPDFYADYGSVTHGRLSNPKQFTAKLAQHQIAEAFALAQEHAEVSQYFVLIVWTSLEVGRFPCSQEEYEQQIVPQVALEAVKAYKSPFD